MHTRSLSRRQLLLSSLAWSTAALKATRTPLAASALFAAVERALFAQPTDTLAVLAPGEADELAAVAARIIPTDDTPGATEAGAIYFIDRVLASSHAELLPEAREGLSSLQSTARAAYGRGPFSALAPAEQDALLRQIEGSPFFSLMRFLTICGTFSAPQYGGNRDYVGWRLIGFDHRHVWQAPYGYYDADYSQNGE